MDAFYQDEGWFTWGGSMVQGDDGARGMAVYGNVFYKAGYRTALIGGGSDNPYNNNIFIESPVVIYVDNRMQRDKSLGKQRLAMTSICNVV